MTDAVRKLLPVLLIGINALIWPFWIIPGIAGILSRNKPVTMESAAIGQSPPDRLSANKILNFTVLRDPFQFPGQKPDRAVRVQKPEKPSGQSPSTGIPADKNRKFVSRFRLRSVVLLKGQYIATLEEIPHYGTSPSPNTYRFGSVPQQEIKTVMVTEGETVSGEKVLKIRENAVIMIQDGQTDQLNFSGGQ